MLARLQALEYAIRLSMPVREDQEDAADTGHIAEAIQCGVQVAPDASKGELLTAVQTLLRTLAR